MSAWSLYFLAKLGLYWGQFIGLHWAENLLFAAALAWPLKGRRWHLARHVLAVPVALALLYHDAFLPPVSRLWSQLGALASFSPDYVVELAARFIAWPVVAALAGLVLAYVLLQRRLRFTTLAVLGLMTVPLLPAPGFWARTGGTAATLNPLEHGEAGSGPMAPGQLEARLSAFHATESDKAVTLPAGITPGFDIVMLSMCSLSWDDLDEVRLRDAPLLRRFDIVFRQFNTAASYSGPALLRLLRANCGQTPQAALYSAAPAGCYLFDSLARAGYRPALLMNHDGRFDGFAQQLRDHGGVAAAPAEDSGAPVAMRAFDGTPIHADGETLARWWRKHSADPAPLALMYNSVTLHDGNRVPGLASQRSQETYKPRLLKLFAELDQFIALVEASGRPTLLMLVPEHGGAVRGDAVQVSGLREIPTPAVTNVPVAVKLIGFDGLAPGQAPISVERPSSYFALASLVAALMPGGRSVGGREQLEALVRELPGTDWVSENDGTVLLRQGRRSDLRSPRGDWTPYQP
ncbi:MAG: cellulose biosynthesis protein BcsG [Leptothrix sp. (in: Bacteria)]|nr:cellulose biosynthesis protein BcsG [Leptothrix sp. (in: b-proteobacteria)]